MDPRVQQTLFDPMEMYLAGGVGDCRQEQVSGLHYTFDKLSYRKHKMGL